MCDVVFDVLAWFDSVHRLGLLHWAPVFCSGYSIWLPSHNFDRRRILCRQFDYQLFCGEHDGSLLYLQSPIWFGIQLHVLCGSGSNRKVLLKKTIISNRGINSWARWRSARYGPHVRGPSENHR